MSVALAVAAMAGFGFGGPRKEATKWEKPQPVAQKEAAIKAAEERRARKFANRTKGKTVVKVEEGQ